ncbi:phytase [Zobellia galactanivorans]|uniref:3-Phytase n=1 Tax=Zobellia galactanivorans (strain DSM 12802 / CCUG 47099 / CIP 106680 / NCIMB 13871 / Dsij) TaxID=63186 RepID=G0L3R2_ZOBGA|nr:phytase [Zobellia galactanivorans]CAZ95410.1 3-Phytase [Zobellia galactanivorans]
MKNIFLFLLALMAMQSCNTSQLPAVAPNVITEKTVNDTDDPAIWVNPMDASKSIVFGTDKETNGAIYAFDLNGKILEEKSISDIRRPNNVDIAYGFAINDTTKVDILMFTEREKSQVRLFSVPDMKPLDNGGFPVFADEKNPEMRLPMGVSLYKSSKDQSIYAIVGRKTGPTQGYLYQYKIVANDKGQVNAELVRKFGKFSGKKEIEAIAVDHELGFVYYSDEQHCIRKYYAEPSMGDVELSCFGGENFKSDIEGIAIAQYPNGEGYIIVSDQQRGQFNIYSRKTNAFVRAVNLSTLETDGCEVVTVPLNDTFKSGLFVAMNDEKNFYFYDLEKLGIE